MHYPTISVNGPAVRYFHLTTNGPVVSYWRKKK